MKITEEAVQKIYIFSKAVFEGRVTKQDALIDVENEGFMNTNSANIYIQNYKCLMNGRPYKRAMNFYSTEYFLRRIGEDSSSQDFSAALSACRGHLDYFDTLGKGHQVSISELVDRLEEDYGLKR
jgi:5-methylcytosine-specific restriction enzyme A